MRAKRAKLIAIINLNNNLLEFEVVVKGNAYAKIDEDKILDDLTKATKPRFMKITGVFTPRGGINTRVEVIYKK